MRIIRLTAGCLAFGLAASPALALEVSHSVEVPVSAAEVWQTIAGFCAIQDWHPVVERCVEDNAGGATMRTLTTVDGAVLVEKRVQYSDEGMSYTYEIVDSPLPVADYVSTLAVMDGMGGATITWSGEFTARGASDEEARAVISGIYAAGLGALQERLR